MRAVITSDWHLDARTCGVERAPEIQVAVTQSVDRAITWEADAYFFLGDLCDPEPDRIASAGPIHRAVGFACEMAAKCVAHGIDFIAIPGNHCVVEDGSGAHVLEALRGTGAVVVDRPAWRWIGGVPTERAKGGATFVFLPFAPLSHGYDPAEFVESLPHDLGLDPIIFLGHLNAECAPAGSETDDMPRGRDVFWPLAEIYERFSDALCVGGHYHRGGCYSFAGPRRESSRTLHIAGSPARMTFGEQDHEPSFLELEVGMRETRLRRVPIRGSRRLITIGAADLVPDRSALEGSLVRVLAAPGQLDTEVGDVAQTCRLRGAEVKVVPAPAPLRAARAEEAEKRERPRRRDVVRQIAAQVASEDRDALLAGCERLMAEEGV